MSSVLYCAHDDHHLATFNKLSQPCWREWTGVPPLELNLSINGLKFTSYQPPACAQLFSGQHFPRPLMMTLFINVQL